MVHFFLVGLVLGWGASIPIGPMNIEMMRRHLMVDPRDGVSFGVGACLADVLYFLLMYYGVLTFLESGYPYFWVGCISSIVLLLFASMAWFAKVKPRSPIEKTIIVKEFGFLQMFRSCCTGFAMTAVNPYTIIFWLSVGSQAAVMGMKHDYLFVFMGAGVLVAALAWVVLVNGVLHKIKFILPDKYLNWMNRSGAFMLFAFAIYSGIHAYQMWLQLSG